MKINNLTKVKEFRLKLYVKNFYKTKEFYNKILGYKIIKSWDEHENQGAMFDTGYGVVIELLTPDEKYVKIQGCDVSLRVKDVWKLYNELKSKVKIIKKISNREWGDTDFKIEDPEGFSITFFSKTKK